MERPDLDLAALPEELARRVRLTITCRDCDSLPKVANAGETFATEDGTRVQVMHNGVLVLEDAYYGPMITAIIRGLRGHHEPQEELVFHRVIERIADGGATTPCFIEFGSHWAYYSLWFLDAFPSGRTICVEPDPNNLEVGRRNFELNGHVGEFRHAAVGDRPIGSIEFQPESMQETIRLAQESLESVIELHGVGYADAILVDTQGAEEYLLDRVTGEFLRARVRFVFISTHDLSISGSAITHQEVLRKVLALGGHIVAEHSVSESFSGDGLVVASFSDLDADFQVPVSFARSRDSLFGEWEPRVEHYRLLAERMDELEGR